MPQYGHTPNNRAALRDGSHHNVHANSGGTVLPLAILAILGSETPFVFTEPRAVTGGAKRNR
jgi:hypothetical protein